MAVVDLRAAGPADAVLLARLHVAVWRETYAALLPREVERLDLGQRQTSWLRDLLAEAEGARPGRTHVLFVDGLPAGFVTAGAQRYRAVAEMGYDGEIWSLYLLAAHQGRGLGRRLVEAAAEELARRGHWAVSAQVLETNLRAGQVYMHLGARAVARLEAGTRSEVTYAWEDLHELLPARMRRSGVPPLR